MGLHRLLTIPLNNTDKTLPVSKINTGKIQGKNVVIPEHKEIHS